ncbi:hypothetical protein BaRGS_00026670 [Batillaria attramentaria]|uniref:Uncharacterized protein n=1 Tax=Batillaria attramentaria TaxID=370345 RepID=A0ABD0K5I1_9CAEN
MSSTLSCGPTIRNETRLLEGIPRHPEKQRVIHDCFAVVHTFASADHLRCSPRRPTYKLSLSFALVPACLRQRAAGMGDLPDKVGAVDSKSDSVLTEKPHYSFTT